MGTQRQRHQTYTQTQTERRHKPKSKKDRNTLRPPKLAPDINAARGFGGREPAQPQFQAGDAFFHPVPPNYFLPIFQDGRGHHRTT